MIFFALSTSIDIVSIIRTEEILDPINTNKRSVIKHVSCPYYHHKILQAFSMQFFEKKVKIFLVQTKNVFLWAYIQQTRMKPLHTYELRLGNFSRQKGVNFRDKKMHFCGRIFYQPKWNRSPTRMNVNMNSKLHLIMWVYMDGLTGLIFNRWV